MRRSHAARSAVPHGLEPEKNAMQVSCRPRSTGPQTEAGRAQIAEAQHRALGTIPPEYNPHDARAHTRAYLSRNPGGFADRKLDVVEHLNLERLVVGVLDRRPVPS
jgi:hypothetical protein